MLSGRDFILLCVILSFSFHVIHCEMKLKMLHVLFRHGDKVPHKEYQNYPNDPHRDHSYHPVDNGDLTNEGKMREYKIGRMLRERYDEYFGPYYRPGMIYAQSTFVPRTQLSLQLVLAGLFPPVEKQIWNPRLLWIPTWSYSAPLEADNLLFPHYCPRYQDEYKRFLLRSDIKEMINKYKNVMAYLTDHTGKLVNTTSGVYYLYNLLKEEAAQNLTLPKWTLNVYPSPMMEITALDFKLRSYNDDLKRLNGGMILRRIKDNIQSLRTGDSEIMDTKGFFFSAHEVNVVALARTLGLEEPTLPAYGSTLILETHVDENNIYYVRVLLWTGVTEALIIQEIPNCTEYCAFDKFLKLMKNVIPSDEEYRCRSVQSERDYHEYQYSSAVSYVEYQIRHYIFVTMLTVSCCIYSLFAR